MSMMIWTSRRPVLMSMSIMLTIGALGVSSAALSGCGRSDGAAQSDVTASSQPADSTVPVALDPSRISVVPTMHILDDRIVIDFVVTDNAASDVFVADGALTVAVEPDSGVVVFSSGTATGDPSTAGVIRVVAGTSYAGSASIDRPLTLDTQTSASWGELTVLACDPLRFDLGVFGDAGATSPQFLVAAAVE